MTSDYSAAQGIWYRTGTMNLHREAISKKSQPLVRQQRFVMPPEHLLNWLSGRVQCVPREIRPRLPPNTAAVIDRLNATKLV